MTVLRVTEVHNINRESQSDLTIGFVLVPIVRSWLPCEHHMVHQWVIPIGDSCVSIEDTHVVGKFEYQWVIPLYSHSGISKSDSLVSTAKQTICVT